MEKLNAIREQVIQLCDPQKILLFGSQAKGTATAKSDIDLCIIASTNDKRSLLTDCIVIRNLTRRLTSFCIRRRSGNTAWQIARALPTS